MHKLRSAFLLPLVACSTPPRVTTQSERDAAIVFLNTAQTALVVAAANGKIDQAKLDLATNQLAALRTRVDASATEPVQWTVLYSDLLAFATQWALPAPKQ